MDLFLGLLYYLTVQAVNTKRQIFRNIRGGFVLLVCVTTSTVRKYMFECPSITRNTTESTKRDLSCKHIVLQSYLQRRTVKDRSTTMKDSGYYLV